jgi:hypothetical protein
MLTDEIRTWLDAQKLGLPVVVTDGNSGLAVDAIELSLAGVEQSASLNDIQTRPLRLILTYRVTFRAKQAADAHRALCEFMFAVMGNPMLTPAKGARAVPLTLVPGDIAARRFGPLAGPVSAHLEAILERQRIEKPTQLVREPAVVRPRTMN